MHGYRGQSLGAFCFCLKVYFIFNCLICVCVYMSVSALRDHKRCQIPWLELKGSSTSMHVLTQSAWDSAVLLNWLPTLLPITFLQSDARFSFFASSPLLSLFISFLFFFFPLSYFWVDTSGICAGVARHPKLPSQPFCILVFSDFLFSIPYRKMSESLGLHQEFCLQLYLVCCWNIYWDTSFYKQIL